jgi:hypothetical protein
MVGHNREIDMSRGLKICGDEADAYFTPDINCEQTEEEKSRSVAVAEEKKAKLSE